MSEQKLLIEGRIRKNIADKNYKDLLIALEVAEKYNPSLELLFEGWKLGAEYLESKGKPVDTIIALNKARKIKPSVVFVFDKLIAVWANFFTRYRKEFLLQKMIC